MLLMTDNTPRLVNGFYPGETQKVNASFETSPEHSQGALHQDSVL